MGVDDLTRRRLEHNEEVFRTVNEEIDDRETDRAARAYVCECADRGCRETIVLTQAEYRRVRDQPSRFLVVPGHEVPGLEHVVERHDSHLVVEKP